MANPIAAIIGADQPDACLVIGREGNFVGSEAPRLIAEADAFPLGASGAGEQNAIARRLIAPIRGEGSCEREAEPPAVGTH